MKFNKIIKKNIENRNVFITCMFSVLMVLVLCYFGINTASKGTHSYLNANGLTQLDFTDYSCSDSTDKVGTFIKTYLDGTEMKINVEQENVCMDIVSTATCYVTGTNNGTVLAETCSQYNYDYYCTNTGSEVIYQRYKKCTRGTDIEYCDVQSNTGCDGYSSQGYTCDWAESDTYSCTNYSYNGPAEESTKTCVYGYFMSSDETTVATISKVQGGASDGANCPCPGSNWIETDANHCTQNITDIQTGYSYLKDGMEYCSSSFTESGSLCLLSKETETMLVAYFLATEVGYVQNNSCTLDSTSCDVDVPSVEPVRTNYEFLGWAEGSTDACDSPITSNIVKISDNTNFYACWNEGSSSGENTTTYAISYHSNAVGVLDLPLAQVKTHDVDLILSSFIPERDGYDFNGWNTEKDGSGTSYAPSATYTSNAPLTLYAQWTANSSGDSGGATTPEEKETYTATFNANNGKFATGVTSITKECAYAVTGAGCAVYMDGSAVSEHELPEVTREGYAYQGWGTSSSCTSGNYTYQVLTNDTTYYACWKAVEVKEYYTVKYNLNGGTFPNKDTSRTDVIVSDANLVQPKINPIKEGYKFVGWYNGNTKFTGFNKTIDKDYELTAHYEKITDTKCSYTCNSNDVYDPSIKKCVSINVNGNSFGTVSTVINLKLVCKNSVATYDEDEYEAPSGYTCASGYDKEYWLSSDTCELDGPCVKTGESCVRTFKAICYKTYNATEKCSNNATDTEGNATDNPQTGDIVIALVWFFGLAAVGYSFYYFKNLKQN